MTAGSVVGMEHTDPAVLEALDTHTARLEETLDRLGDVTAPSLCEGWTRGHVLTHLARNADGILALTRAAVDGTGETMYASPEARDADIEAGAGRDLAAQAVDVRTTAADVRAGLHRLRPEHGETRMERTPGQVLIPARRLPSMRLREVVYHHVDLDAGFGFADVEPELVTYFLEDEVSRLRHAEPVADVTLRTDDGAEWVVGEGTSTVTGSRVGLLAWLARGDASGVTADPLPHLPGGR